MILRSVTVAVAAIGLSASAFVAARTEPSTSGAKRFEALPDTVAGLKRSDGGYSAPLASYGNGKGVEPLVVVAIVDTDSPDGVTDMAIVARGSVRRAGVVKTLFEGQFSIPGRPNAKTYFADFLTEQGVKQVWIADYDDARTTIVATIYRSEDRRPIFDAIRNNVLGGAVMIRPATSVWN